MNRFVWTSFEAKLWMVDICVVPAKADVIIQDVVTWSVVHFYMFYSSSATITVHKLEIVVEFHLLRRINLEYLGVQLVVSLFFSWRIETWPLRSAGCGWWNWRRGGPSANK